MQLPWHSAEPGAQPHLLALHCSVAGHATPQLPQLASSVRVSTQAPLQLLVPDGQLVAQAPFAHTWPALQTLPHAPQFFGSVLTLLHTPGVHSVVPVSHVHLPLTQLERASLQIFPQPPQLLGSVPVSTQPSRSSPTRQEVSPPGHWQLPI